MPRSRQANPNTLYFPDKLRKRLSAIQRYPLTLVEAPSGFGKTTALRHFFDTAVSEAASIHWHTLLGESPAAAWSAFCRLISGFDPKSGEKLLTLGPPEPDTLPLIADTIAELSCPQDTYIVLDNFTEDAFSPEAPFLSALRGHSVPGLHFVIICQQLTDDRGPMLENHRLYRMSASDFVFTRQDVDAYYRQAGFLLSEPQLEQVYGATQGWVMALYLQMLAFADSGNFDSGDMDALVRHALWEKLSPEEQSFFLSISIFPRFMLWQAAETLGRDHVETEALLRGKKVFVNLDKETHSYYLHSIFATFLKGLFDTLPESQKTAIYLAGGDLALRAEDRIHTLRFYYEARAFEKIFAMGLTSFEIPDMVDEEIAPIVLDILEHTPFAVKAAHPDGMIAIAFTLFFLHEHQRLMAIQDEIAQAIAQSDLTEAGKNALYGEMQLLLSFLEYNKIDKMSQRHTQALRLLNGSATLISIKKPWTFGSPSVLHMFYRESGKLEEALGQMDTCMPIYYQLTGGHGSGAEIIMRAEAAFLSGDADGAEVLCHRALFAADRKRQNSIYQCGLFLLARIALQRGDEELLQDTVRSMTERARQNTEDLCRHTLDLSTGFLSMLTGGDGMLPAWLLENELYGRRLVVMTQPFAHIIHGGVLARRGEYRKLLGLGPMFLGIAGIFPNLLPQIYTHIHMAVACDGLGMEQDAVSHLAAALALALPDRIYMPFAENGAALAKLLPLVTADENRQAMERIAALAKEFRAAVRTIDAKKVTLSPREREVAALIQKDFSNPQIAAALHISVSTVKMTIKHICEKTGTNSKMQIAMLKL